MPPWFRDALEMHLVASGPPLPPPQTWEERLRQAGYALVGDRAVQMQPPGKPKPQEVSEAALLGQIITFAKRAGWKVYHTHDSRHSEAGFPDLVLAKPGTAGKAGAGVQPGRLIFAECKRRTGKLTAEQAQWLALLSHTLPDLEVYTWRPADWPAIEVILCGRRPALQPGEAP